MMFRLTIFLVVSGLQYLLLRKARTWARLRFPGSARAQHILMGLYAFFCAGLFFALFFGSLSAHLPGWVLTAVSRPFYVWEGATIALGLAVLAGILIASPVRLARAALSRFPRTAPAMARLKDHPSAAKFDAARRAFLFRGMEGLTAVSFGAATYGVIEGRSGYEFTEASIPVAGLPPQLDGFTIGLVSDIHSSSFMTKKQMDGYCSALMSYGTDLIVVPGDFVNSQTEEVYPFAESFSALRAPCGVYGVMGNHDFFAPDPERVAREVDGCGVTLLRNDSVIITKNGARMALMGIDDVGRRERAASYIQSALHGVPEGIPRILLSHRPYFLGEAAGAGMDLVLSGHTHGGQIVVGRIGPVVLTPAAIASPYIAGIYSRGRTQMYVSRGIGTVALPMRLNCPPEITRITLRPAPEGPRREAAQGHA